MQKGFNVCPVWCGATGLHSALTSTLLFLFAPFVLLYVLMVALTEELNIIIAKKRILIYRAYESKAEEPLNLSIAPVAKWQLIPSASGQSSQHLIIAADQHPFCLNKVFNNSSWV